MATLRPAVRFGAFLLLACSGEAPESLSEPAPEPSAASEAPSAELAEPEAPQAPAVDFGFDARTSRGATALRNLDAQLDVAQTPEQKVALLLTRARYTGSYDDFAEAERLARAAVEAEPDERSAHATMASVHSALHRFEEAGASLDRADALSEPGRHARERIVLELALGRVNFDLEIRARRLVETRRVYETLTTLASVVAARGRFAEADMLYIEATRSLRDVSPFPIAYVLFARGVMWAEMANQPEKARPLYEEAVRRLPQYVVANVHLSELEVESNDQAQALQRLESVLDTGDPEPAGSLAELLAESEDEADKARAVELTERAKARYDVLLERHRLAFADHGAEFFMGPGDDAERALELAEANLRSRPTPRAAAVAIDAAVAAEQGARACEIAAEHAALRAHHPVFDEVASEVEGCS
ncbi:MAG: hypothetical protein AAF411_17255 [Myxococcota bacterium]